MSEHITHTAVVDDCARLALHSHAICDAFKVAFRRHLDVARLGCMTRSGDRFTVQLLREARERWPARREGDFVEEKLAFVLGWRCHLAADRQFKPVYRQLDPAHYGDQPEEDTAAPSDVSVYHDVVLFREIYASGGAEPYHRALLDYRLESHPAFRSMASEVVQDLWGGLYQWSLLAAQSFLAGEGNFERRVALFLARLQPRPVDVHRYAQAFHNPDPDKMRRFIVEPNFYTAADPVIALARSIQRGAPDKSMDFAKAVAASASGSQYAQALRRGYSYLEAASDFFAGRIGEEELATRSDLGRPHVPKQ